MTNRDFSFTKSLERLEAIVEKLEKDDLELEEATELIAEGLVLHKKCLDKISGAKKRIDGLLSESEIMNE